MSAPVGKAAMPAAAKGFFVFNDVDVHDKSYKLKQAIQLVLFRYFFLSIACDGPGWQAHHNTHSANYHA